MFHRTMDLLARSRSVARENRPRRSRRRAQSALSQGHSCAAAGTEARQRRAPGATQAFQTFGRQNLSQRNARGDGHDERSLFRDAQDHPIIFGPGSFGGHAIFIAESYLFNGLRHHFHRAVRTRWTRGFVGTIAARHALQILSVHASKPYHFRARIQCFQTFGMTFSGQPSISAILFPPLDGDLRAGKFKVMTAEGKRQTARTALQKRPFLSLSFPDPTPSLACVALGPKISSRPPSRKDVRRGPALCRSGSSTSLLLLICNQ